MSIKEKLRSDGWYHRHEIMLHCAMTLAVFGSFVGLLALWRTL